MPCFDKLFKINSLLVFVIFNCALLSTKQDFVTINHAKCYAVRGGVTVLCAVLSFAVLCLRSKAYALGVFSLISVSR